MIAVGTHAALAAMTLDAHAVIEQDDEMGTAVASGDFNGDGYDDIAVGVPGQVINGNAEAGAVLVYHGSSTGMTLYWSFDQDTLNIAGTAEAGDRFGSALVAADFDGNGTDDLAVGVPYETVGGGPVESGYVNVIYSNASGLQILGNEGFGLADMGSSRFPEQAYAHFGSVLTAADLQANPTNIPPWTGFNHADLVVGAPDYDVWRRNAGGYFSSGSTYASATQYADAGLLAVIWADDRTTGANLDPTYAPTTETVRMMALGCSLGDPALDVCAVTGIGGTHMPRGQGEHFGAALAVNMDRFNPGFLAHLLVGAPGRPTAGGVAAGEVFHINSSGGGHNGTCTNSGSTQDACEYGIRTGHTMTSITSAIAGGGTPAAAAGDQFGCAIASGWASEVPFSGTSANRRQNIAIGACGRTVGGASGAGSVFFKKASNLWIEITQSTLVGDSAEANDAFGSSLAFANVNGVNTSGTGGASTSFDDLIIGVPGEVIDVGHVADGAINTVLSDGLGSLQTTAQVLHEGLASIAGVTGSGDEFGACVATGNFHSSAYGSVVVGVPGQDSTSFQDTGKVQLIFGSSTGLNGGTPDVDVWDF
jgi:hypothetical protein